MAYYCVMRKFYTVIIVLLFTILNTANFAFASNVPNFPSCTELNSPGNWSSVADEYNHIPGQEENIFGDDDVYYLEGGNFVQCLCPADSETGVQTNWWDITDEDINTDDYTSNGWFLEFGYNWNLIQDSTYLAKNSDYTCREPEPTPTPTPTPSPTPTPDNHSSECTNLTASTTSGTEDLTVEFQGEGLDTNGYIEEYRFDFGDDTGGPQIVTQTGSSSTHRYEEPGNYTARLQVKDSKGVWKGSSEKCEVNINVLSQPQVLGASDVKELPKTGPKSLAIFASILASATGLAIYRKYSRV